MEPPRRESLLVIPVRVGLEKFMGVEVTPEEETGRREEKARFALSGPEMLVNSRQREQATNDGTLYPHQRRSAF